MEVTIFGSGYVGLVTGACLAEVGNDVLCIDVDPDKIDLLNSGGVPIYEPGLDELIRNNREAGRLRFSTDAEAGVKHGLFQFIAVGTPPDEDGSADLQYVLSVARTIGQHMEGYRILVDKSTVPVGTADKVAETVRAALAERDQSIDFDVVSNPEFLKEGAAIEDFMRPDRIIVGTDNPRTAELLRALYAPFNRNRDRLMVMDVRSAELTKYAANAMLATKISFMNELSNIAEIVGADIEKVRVGIGSDPRIGYQFIYPGCGYGGSCFPKDVRALERTARGVGYDPQLLQAVEAVNFRQKELLFDKLKAQFDGDLAGRTIALWGLAFKPNTDDMREASSRVLMESLWAAGAKVQAFDPVAMDEARRIYGERPDLVLAEDATAALAGADALVIVTEWTQFRSPNFRLIRDTLARPLLLDGRNILDPQQATAAGLTYLSIGRAPATPA
ncbi:MULTISPECIES: UDP-glucose/GDP-mannose dehydrogenase family protein [Marichromatium]|uniref:UDP-glucose 6-dehydrogenase n=1 Tax=Marichromatium gracile TaxID=1048 RepID=A0A4R4A6M7_MARGR|nr:MULTISPECIES: UDP-glucose/GDP-mannose dehydrogenase family protein [Marichromatium]MBK1708610.1 UDP-glucose 6-dehydrogenase [Marichromatium gracile]MBO8084713.1 UDP-glucose/GDP-mannose dehydrogenase family protein [Marichromatium sp.]RNE89213.1 UDP-glucose/GDP-mannose dehydrogenase family protein [Marichromatium sp. AB31]TCW34461.1 UDPglucose 6-dehydrogenase [Marichromatium gracile]